MSFTAKRLFYSASKYAGITTGTLTGLDQDEEEDLRQTYNSMIDSWRGDGLTVSHVGRYEFPLVANQGDYTIGPGGNFDRVWPERMERAGIIVDDDAEYPIYPLTLEEWSLWRQKKQASNWPRRYFWERAFPLGILHLLYIPSDTSKVALYLEDPISQIVKPGGTPPDYDAVTLDYAPGYQLACESNLGMLYAAANSSRAKPTAEARRIAKASLDLLKTNNNRPLCRTTDLAATTNRSNIYNGNRWGN